MGWDGMGWDVSSGPWVESSSIDLASERMVLEHEFSYSTGLGYAIHSRLWALGRMDLAWVIYIYLVFALP